MSSSQFSALGPSAAPAHDTKAQVSDHATPGLDRVHLLVGSTQQADDVVRPVQLSHADAESDTGSLRLGLDPAQLGPPRVGDGVREDAYELIAAVANDQVLAAQAGPERVGEAAQQLVARLVAARVVSLLQPVDVEEGDREGALLASRTGDLPVERRDPCGAPHDTSELVESRFFTELEEGLGAHGDELARAEAQVARDRKADLRLPRPSSLGPGPAKHQEPEGIEQRENRDGGKQGRVQGRSNHKARERNLDAVAGPATRAASTSGTGATRRGASAGRGSAGGGGRGGQDRRHRRARGRRAERDGKAGGGD